MIVTEKRVYCHLFCLSCLAQWERTEIVREGHNERVGMFTFMPSVAACVLIHYPGDSEITR